MAGSLPISLAELQSRAPLARDYPGSFVTLEGAAFWLEVVDGVKQLAVLTRPEKPLLARFMGTQQPFWADYALRLCPADAANAHALRAVLPWLRPALLGLTTSAGFGDRLGVATPGHVRALEQVLTDAPGRAIAPIFAQQSIREMERTNRSAVDVLTDATWGAFQAGWRGTLGADADHLKTPGDIDATVAAGFTFFTIDPGAYVDNKAKDAPAAVVRRKVAALPWQELESDPTDLLRRYAGQSIAL
ncbi:MAG TPA: tagaturonate epimerase family protein, partial [Herpetosiphonaceae bacterium]|nr:tagaturonate epimerase family protein [Herpetosiphonaceae bacterium]